MIFASDCRIANMARTGRYQNPLGHLRKGIRTLTKGREDTRMRVGGHLQEGGRTLVEGQMDAYEMAGGHLREH